MGIALFIERKILREEVREKEVLKEYFFLFIILSICKLGIIWEVLKGMKVRFRNINLFEVIRSKGL